MAVKCYINRREYPVVGEIEIADHAAATSESTVTVDIRGLPEPQAFDIVYLFDNEDRLLYGGLCNIPKSPQWVSPFTPHHYELTISGMNNLLTRRYVNKVWNSANIHEIVTEIYETILAGENIQLGGISAALADLPKQKYVSPDMTAYDVLTELAELIGAAWNIEINRSATLHGYLGSSKSALGFYSGDTGVTPLLLPFQFYETESFHPFSFTFLLQQDFPTFQPEQSDVLIGPQSHVLGLQKTVQSYDVRTVQVMKGAFGLTDPQTEQFIFQAEQKSVVLTWPVAELPTITVNGVKASVGLKELEEESNPRQFLVTYNSAEIEINDKYTPALKAGALIGVHYVGYFALRIRVPNPERIEHIAQQSRTSGILEAIEENTRYSSASELVSYAVSKLYNNAEPEMQISLTVSDEQGTEPFTIWKLSFPEQHIQGDFVVVERIRTIGPGYQVINLTLKDKGFLTAYGTIFYQNYKNNPTDIRDSEIIVDTKTVDCRVNTSNGFAFIQPLMCYADDGQPWIQGGAYTYYAGY